jgi:hypothetical protein
MNNHIFLYSFLEIHPYDQKKNIKKFAKDY